MIIHVYILLLGKWVSRWLLHPGGFHCASLACDGLGAASLIPSIQIPGFGGAFPAVATSVNSSRKKQWTKDTKVTKHLFYFGIQFFICSAVETSSVERNQSKKSVPAYDQEHVKINDKITVNHLKPLRLVTPQLEILLVSISKPSSHVMP